MSQKYPYQVIDEPIDFNRLANSYASERWHWIDGFPNERSLMEWISKGKKYVKSQPDESGFLSSGGITIKYIEHKIAVLIHGKLIKHYLSDIIRLDWLETAPPIPLDCSLKEGIDPELQRARITRKEIDRAMNLK